MRENEREAGRDRDDSEGGAVADKRLTHKRKIK